MTIAHLRGREKALEPLGWTGAEAEWIALVCLHSGIFTRSQFCFYFDVRPNRAHRFVRALVQRGSAAEPNTPRYEGAARACRIFDKRIYRALGIQDVKHRREATFDLTLRRLLSFDYVLEHPNLRWLPTEGEKVACFDGLGIGRDLLPRRVYKGAAGAQKRFFALKLPIAMDTEIATFIYVDPGHETDNGIRSWGGAHRRLWNALLAKGIAVRIVAIARNREALDRAVKWLRTWATTTPKSQPQGMTAKQEIEHITQAILDGDWAGLDERYGGLNPAIQRKDALMENPVRNVGEGVSITDYRAVCTGRIHVLENWSGAETEDEPEGTWRVETV